MSTHPALLTPAELAAALRCSERTISRMALDGCPFKMVGRRPRYELAQVLAWTEERAQECLSEKTPPAGGTPRPASAVKDFTAACRRVQLRVMPSA